MTKSKGSSTRSSMQKVEVVLGGGGIKGFAHLGVLSALEDLKVATGTFTGVSIGSAIAALYTNGYSPAEMTEILQTEFAEFNRRNGGDSALRRAGRIRLLPFFQEIAKAYNLQPRRNLRIVAYDIVKRKPVVFEGTNYDLPVAIAASCTIPGLMLPVWQGVNRTTSTLRTIYERWLGVSEDTFLVDGGIYNPAPGDFCKSTAIISRLGAATQLPSTRLPALDLVFHLIEYAGAAFLRRYFPEDGKHITIRSAQPDIATVTFGLSRKQYRSLADYGYKQTRMVLEPAIADGRIPTGRRRPHGIRPEGRQAERLKVIKRRRQAERRKQGSRKH